MADFEKAIAYVLGDEGGESNRPNDRGGHTNFGITQDMLEKFSPGASLSLLTIDQAKAIYKKAFWIPIRLDEVQNQSFATAILDIAVNEGQFSAVKFAQQALGFLACDGILGSKTIESLNAANTRDFLLKFIGAVQDRYADIVVAAPTQLEFLKGWLRRSRRILGLL
jgi:lysozyme family protein